MKCAILGGTGFIGRHLIKALSERGHTCRSLSRHAPIEAVLSIQEDGLDTEWMIGDYENKGDIQRLLAGQDVCIHLVSSSLPSTSNRDPSWDISTNVCSTLQVLEQSVAAGIKKVIFLSSGGTIYGEARDLPIREDHPLEPTCSYAISKLAIEKYLALFNRLYGLDYNVIRLGNPYGPGQEVNKAQGAISVFIERFRHSSPIQIWGDGTVIRDYIYIDDAIDGIVRTLEQGVLNKIYNIGSGIGLSLVDIIDALTPFFDTKPPIEFLPARKFDIQRNVLDITSAKKDLAFRVSTDLPNGIRNTINWQEDQKLVKIIS